MAKDNNCGRDFNATFLAIREEQIEKEMLNLKEKYGFSINNINTTVNFYMSQKTIKVGDVSKNVSLMYFILGAIGFGESKEENLNFVRNNLRLFLDANINFGIKLAILSHFDFLRDAIRNNYLSRLRLPVRVLYALLSSNIKFDSILELEEIYDRMSLEEINAVIAAHPLTSDNQKELYGEMMSRMHKRNELRRQLLNRRAAKKASEK